jgi:glycosyltransferase involved in cell wall biosynthesis
MHIAFLNQFFWPDTAATGQLLADLSRAIGAEESGVKTTVICGKSDYGIQDTTSPPPSRILRAGCLRFSRGVLGRLLSYGSFIAGAVWNSYRIERPDIIITLTTPPLISVLGRMIKLMRDCEHYIWEMDVYPDIAVDLEVLRRDSMLTSVIGIFADWSRRHADGIIVLGDDMKARLIARGIPEDRIFVAENWANGSEITPRPFPEGRFVVHYSGTLGLVHDIDTIAGAMNRLRNDPRFCFTFAGGGARREYLENYCQEHGIKNVIFRPYCSRDELGSSLSEGHIGLVTQLPQTCGSVVPSKTYGIMAAGRPILYVGPSDATPARIIDHHSCGWRIDPSDVNGLVRLLEHLEVNRELVYNAGSNGRQAFEQHYDVRIGVRRIINILGVKLPHVLSDHSRRDSIPAFVVSDTSR